MISYNKNTPLLLPVTGTLETINSIFALLKQIEPQRLYLAYYAIESEEYKNYQHKIQLIFSDIPWKCNVRTLKVKKHLGYNPFVLKAVRWFFRHETEGIVLNCSVTPFPAFFAFCSCMLEKYRHDERIGHISGTDFLKPDRKLKTKGSYYFSKLVNVAYGWASWRRVWKDVDTHLKTFPTFKKMNIIEEIPSHKPFRFQWHFLQRYENKLKWNFRYEYANLINNRLSVVPYFNQIHSQEFELPEIKHPVFMYNPVYEELRFQETQYEIPAISSNERDGKIFLMEKLFSYIKETAGRIKIPRIIHQIYEDPAGPPDNMLQIAKRWQDHHPDWEYRFWNRQMISDFLESHCSDFLPFYQSWPFNVQRWDSIRYLILYHIGGMYADMDYDCLRPLDILLTGSSCCMGMEPVLHKNAANLLPIGNALMASVPRHPYMAAIIEDMKANFHIDYGKGDTTQILATTGPLMAARVYDRYKRKKDVTLLPADLVSPLSVKEVWMLCQGHARTEVLQKIEKAFAIHYCFGTWRYQTSEGKAWQIIRSKGS